MLGTTKHTGLGTDLDGGFGSEQCPADLDTIADLDRFLEILAKRGYSESDLKGFAHQNFIDFLQQAWT